MYNRSRARAIDPERVQSIPSVCDRSWACASVCDRTWACVIDHERVRSNLSECDLSTTILPCLIAFTAMADNASMLDKWIIARRWSIVSWITHNGPRINHMEWPANDHGRIDHMGWNSGNGLLCENKKLIDRELCVWWLSKIVFLGCDVNWFVSRFCFGVWNSSDLDKISWVKCVCELFDRVWSCVWNKSKTKKKEKKCVWNNRTWAESVKHEWPKTKKVCEKQSFLWPSMWKT